MSVLDAHVQRTPVGGGGRRGATGPARFLAADLLRASADNERNSIVIRTPDGHDVVAVQIAGLIAPIVCDVRAGDTEHRRHLRTGSAAGSAWTPSARGSSQAQVSTGQRAAGETVAAELQTGQVPRRRVAVSCQCHDGVAICPGPGRRPVRPWTTGRRVDGVGSRSRRFSTLLDGRMARVLNATSKMGGEIDSLADAINFGVAPAFIVGPAAGRTRVGWIVVLLYAVCIIVATGALQRADRRRPAGHPSSASSGCRRRPGHRGDRAAGRQMRWGRRLVDVVRVRLAWMIAVSLLVVSRIPMRKDPHLRRAAATGRTLLALLAIITAGAFIFPIWPSWRSSSPTSFTTSRSRCAARPWLAAHPGVEDQPQRQRQAAPSGARIPNPGAPARQTGRSAARLDSDAREAIREPVDPDGAAEHRGARPRRGVVRLHPEVAAALGYANGTRCPLTGSRTTAAVAGRRWSGTRRRAPRCFDDVTLVERRAAEDTTVIVAPVTVYGARSAIVTGSNLASRSVPPATLGVRPCWARC